MKIDRELLALALLTLCGLTGCKKEECMGLELSDSYTKQDCALVQCEYWKMTLGANYLDCPKIAAGEARDENR